MSSLGHALATGSGCGPDGGSTNPLSALADAVLARGSKGRAEPAHDLLAPQQPPPSSGSDLAAAWNAERGLARARAWARACHPGADPATLERHAAALAAGPGPGAAAAAAAVGAPLPSPVHHRHHHHAWADEFAAARPPPPPPPSAAAWAAEFGHHTPAQAWAAEYAHARPPQSSSWADEFGSTTSTSTSHHPTPAERKAARGPSPDDPVDDPAAPTWVAQFNGSLGGRTVNTEGGLAGLVADCGLTPADANPMMGAPDPAGAAAAAVRGGRFADAALAYEVAARRDPSSAATWLELGRVRRAVGDAAGAVKALRLSVGCCGGGGGAVLHQALLELAAAAADAGGAKDREVGTAAIGLWAEGAGVRGAPLDAALEAAARRTSNPAAFTALGTLRLLRNQPLPAADAFAGAVAANPADPAALTALGRALTAGHRADHADRALAAAVRADPAHAPAWLALAALKSSTDAHEAAARAYAHAARLVPDCAAAWDGLGLASVAAGRVEWAAAAERRGDLGSVGL